MHSIVIVRFSRCMHREINQEGNLSATIWCTGIGGGGSIKNWLKAGKTKAERSRIWESHVKTETDRKRQHARFAKEEKAKGRHSFRDSVKKSLRSRQLRGRAKKRQSTTLSHTIETWEFTFREDLIGKTTRIIVIHKEKH